MRRQSARARARVFVSNMQAHYFHVSTTRNGAIRALVIVKYKSQSSLGINKLTRVSSLFSRVGTTLCLPPKRRNEAATSFIFLTGRDQPFSVYIQFRSPIRETNLKFSSSTDRAIRRGGAVSLLQRTSELF